MANEEPFDGVQDLSYLAPDLNELRMQSVLCDVTIADESEKTLEAHSVVLAAGSAVLKNALTHQQAQQLLRSNRGLTLKIGGISTEIWEPIVEYLYLRKIEAPISGDLLIELYKAARMLSIDSLVENLSEVICNLNLECNFEKAMSVDVTLIPTSTVADVKEVSLICGHVCS